ncbi:MAG TPA: DinB family protein [Cyclobacteriaceae bacterium]|nr:DinB family protein [Cyclobacteriaceae bacterium]
MAENRKLEVWQRGPIEHIPDLLQPVAHALLQANEEVQRIMEGFPDDLLWEKQYGVASVGFHLNHLTGVLDRLMTYADRKQLSENQFLFLKAEGNPENLPIKAAPLVQAFDQKVQEALEYLQTTSTDDLTAFRGVGRAQLPSTKLGLLFHAAEHAQRHLGQLLVTVRVITAENYHP